MFDKPIISRDVGVITSLDHNQKGLYIYKNTDELGELLESKDFETEFYDKECFTPSIIRRKNSIHR